MTARLFRDKVTFTEFYENGNELSSSMKAGNSKPDERL